MNKDHYIDYSIREVTDEGLIFSKEEISGLKKLGEYYGSLPKTESKSLKPWQVAFSVAGMALILTSCVSAAPGGAENQAITTPTIGPETNPDVSFGIIPTANAKEFLERGEYLKEIYCSDDLKLCVVHQFDQEGKALAPRAYTNSQINFDLDNNAVVVTGDPLIQNDNDVWIYPPHDGQKGYETVETMSVEEALAWMENMSETNQGNMLTVIDEARNKGVGVNILMKTVLNVQKDAEGKDKLVDMIGGLAVSSGEEGATITQLNDTLDPLTENTLLKNQQIVGVNFVPQFDGTEKLVMEVYPSDWKDNGAQWVSTEWFDLQEKIAASGERLTLLPNGTIQDGATVVPGISVDKNGTITLQVGGESVTLDPAKAVFDGEGGFSYPGYTLDEATGEWEPAVPPAESAAIELFDKYGVDPDTYTLAEVNGVIVGTNKETGAEIFRDGRFEISYAVEIAKKDCEPTDFEPDKWGFMQSKDKESLSIYLGTLFDDSNYLISDDAWLWMYWGSIDRARQCWGLFGSDALVYRDETGLAQDIPIIHLTEDEVDEFTSNR